jgi:hypothetical protein
VEMVDMPCEKMVVVTAKLLNNKTSWFAFMTSRF